MVPALSNFIHCKNYQRRFDKGHKKGGYDPLKRLETVFPGKKMLVTNIFSIDVGRGGGGQVVSVLVFYSANLSSNPADVYSFFCKICVEKNENEQKEEKKLAHLKKHFFDRCNNLIITRQF